MTTLLKNLLVVALVFLVSACAVSTRFMPADLRETDRSQLPTINVRSNEHGSLTLTAINGERIDKGIYVLRNKESYLHKGSNKIEVLFEKDENHINKCSWLNAKPGQAYYIYAISLENDVKIWIEEDGTHKRTGHSCKDW